MDVEKQIFIYTVKLKTNNYHHEQFTKRFRMADDIYKTTLREILKRHRKMKKDPRYKKAYQLPKGANRNAILKELTTEYHMRGKFEFGKFANDYRNARRYDTYLPSDVAIALGARAWLAFEKILFAKGAHRVNLNSKISSFEGAHDNGLLIREGRFTIGTKKTKISCPVIYESDEYEEQVLQAKTKYNRLVRRFENGKWNYYVQMVLKGELPIKHTSDLTGIVGIDIGTSTVALSSHYQTELEELAKGIEIDEAEVRRLNRKLNRQRRANNPHKFNEDGTVKSGVREPWNDSKSYLETKTRLHEIHRKYAMRRKLAHKTLANKIVKMGSSFVVEQMSFKGLAARAKETKVNEETGRIRSKKRFGATIGHRAPSMLIEQIRYKANYQGKTFIKANTFEVKASQLDHTTGEYTKVSLDVRTKEIGGHLVQRDLYSAFLLQHVGLDGETVDLGACSEDFDIFLRNQKETMANLETTLSSTGKSKFN